ncbi:MULTISPECIES: STAS-like domain-containing protein [Legionella]|uniref:DUF4325 domain-containing protein n=2 Tax=Legionella TaxID=445 RepID=A0A0W0XZ55_9GAMM|nr:MULTISPECIES: STAS-like domain-containing protein [Legionella]KTD49845.1 hypothetical protein Lrub_0287 [Legionella rubrilucens]RJT46565.1 DUF4325 domain-containing protein [Legionella taurinensis]RJT66659.1 DUF4325 domain-containing protein [Legionella taurinensis]STY25315.1 Uncharacterised protein [Legionella taurinensis]
MKSTITISVYEIVGSPLCVAADDGQKVYERICPALREERKIELSFLNVQLLTSAFLNAAIGQLYGEFSETQIPKLLSVTDCNKDDLRLLKRVVDTAKQYFKNPKKFKDSLKEAGEIDEECTKHR